MRFHRAQTDEQLLGYLGVGLALSNGKQNLFLTFGEGIDRLYGSLITVTPGELREEPGGDVGGDQGVTNRSRTHSLGKELGSCILEEKPTSTGFEGAQYVFIEIERCDYHNIFPSLGPTAFLFFYTPTLAAASPKNTIVGHLIGAVAGYLSLVLFGLTRAAPALATEVTGSRVGAAALSLALTSGLMVWFKVPHPPAGATTLIVSLGILWTPFQLSVLMLAVVLLTVQGFVINRAAGIEYPLWAPPPRDRAR